MTDDERKSHKGWDGSGAYTGLYPPRDPNAEPIPYKSKRPKRRRVGQLNDGEWAPGYGPEGKIRKAK